MLKYIWKLMNTAPNSCEGLIMRAERLEELYKSGGRDNYLLMANCLRELAMKGWPNWKNRKWIRENLRKWQHE